MGHKGNGQHYPQWYFLNVSKLIKFKICLLKHNSFTPGLVCGLSRVLCAGALLVYSMVSYFKSFCVCFLLLGSTSSWFYPLPAHPSWHVNYVVFKNLSFHCLIQYRQPCLVMVAAHRVIVDSLQAPAPLIQLSLALSYPFLFLGRLRSPSLS